ncbi:MAG: hypothetical protein SD837_17930 [Candidatus Electrothrix scaldis]|nr:MAG: hypothetical protein SD837_17930 [Candidatus Electrothrix sp. GW3-3]
MKNDISQTILFRYADHLKNINTASTEQEVLDILAARDAVQTLLAEQEGSEHFGTLLTEINKLDQQLRTQGELVAAKVDLPAIRTGRCPDDTAWWWYFEPAQKKSAWDRLDWLWNSIMAGALALTVSFMMQIFQALSVGGLSWGETFATIAQGGGLALVGSGALTDSGKNRVSQVLANLGIKGIYLAESLCAIALILLAIVYTGHTMLPDYFYKQGESFYEKSNLTGAALKFEQGIQINPDDARFNLSLGKVHESIGNLDASLVQYKIAAGAGDPWGLNNLGRVLLFWVDPNLLKRKLDLAESYLRMALQRAETLAADKGALSDQKQSDLVDLLYQTNRNLGWALLEQKKYKDAESYLRNAISWDKQITHDQIGGGMAYCLLSEAYRHTEQAVLADKNWKKCVKKARPETIFEYKWFMEKGNSADQIYTTSIVDGITEEEFKDFLTKKAQATQSNKKYISNTAPETKEEAQ